MAKLPWMKFFPADYLVDTLPLSPASRGIWMDIICLLWRANTRGQLALTNDQWLKYLRCTSAEMIAACLELTLYDICVVQQISHDLTSISSRRMSREEKTREYNRIRQQKHRVTQMSQPDITPRHKEKLEARSQKLEVRDQKKKKSATHAMPDGWMITDSMKDYAIKKGMTTITLQHQFEHCKEHHAESRFTEKGWTSQVWAKWVLNWISFGCKQVTPQSATFLQSRCAYTNEPCESLAIPGSKYCQIHKEKYQRLQDRTKSLAVN